MMKGEEGLSHASPEIFFLFRCLAHLQLLPPQHYRLYFKRALQSNVAPTPKLVEAKIKVCRIEYNPLPLTLSEVLPINIGNLPVAFLPYRQTKPRERAGGGLPRIFSRGNCHYQMSLSMLGIIYFGDRKQRCVLATGPYSQLKCGERY